jgi:hypothetical protein
LVKQAQRKVACRVSSIEFSGGHKRCSLRPKGPDDFREENVDVIREVDLGSRGEGFLRADLNVEVGIGDVPA